MVIAVTGAGGYVGGRLVEALRADGYDVRPLVRQRRPWLGADQTVVDLTGSIDAVRAAFDGCDAIVHLAGANEIVAGSDPDRALSETIVASRHVAAAGIKRVVYLSTVHVYGDALAPGAVIDETTVPQPRHPYGIARLASEHVLASEADLDLVVLRLTNGVGAPVDPGVDRWSLVVPDLCREAVLSGTVTLKTPGLQWRDFLALSDACAAIAAAVDGTIPPGTWNLGSGRSITVRQVAEFVCSAVEQTLGAHPALRVPTARTGSRHEPYTVDVSRLAGVGVRPSSGVEAAIEETVRFCVEHKERLTSG